MCGVHSSCSSYTCLASCRACSVSSCSSVGSSYTCYCYSWQSWVVRWLSSMASACSVSAARTSSYTSYTQSSSSCSRCACCTCRITSIITISFYRTVIYYTVCKNPKTTSIQCYSRVDRQYIIIHISSECCVRGYSHGSVACISSYRCFK